MAEQFPSHQGLLFYYNTFQLRAFWTAETYFNLDIIFLDDSYVVTAIERNVPNYRYSEPAEPRPRTGLHPCRFILELVAGRSKELNLQVGDRLRWTVPEEIETFLLSVSQHSRPVTWPGVSD
ncbi:DUF192 domain-containing protein [Hahella aquimaris]|uniref:DUF192 domain-containing protein n=1 Tax=Hahella sp. HNIBRBA332 TaxID=3015983 RepID=UPI00352F2D24